MERWKPLRRGYLPAHAFDREHYIKHGIAPEAADELVKQCRRETIWMNDIYQVNVCDATVAEGWPDMLHLSIKRRDRKALRDWRHLQLIKNQIVGPENEAVEVFPAESRLTDSANQYHLWVLKDAALRFPFGFTSRFVCGPDYDGPGSKLPNVKQRPFPVIEEAAENS